MPHVSFVILSIVMAAVTASAVTNYEERYLENFAHFKKTFRVKYSSPEEEAKR